MSRDEQAIEEQELAKDAVELASSIVGEDFDGDEKHNKYFDNIGEYKGKPILQLNADGIKQIKELASYQCKEDEICAFMDVEIGVLKNKYNAKIYKEALEKGRKIGLVQLRRLQFRLANTNSNMAVFLGKNMLHQNEEQNLNLKGSGNSVQIEIVGKSKPKKEEKK